jgi:hypothetical protein
VSTSASQVADPNQESISAVFHVLSYLKNTHNTRLIYDSGYSWIEANVFKRDEDWIQWLYEGLNNAPQPIGLILMIQFLVIVDHLGNTINGHLRADMSICSKCNC